jgi:hypothetical protein
MPTHTITRGPPPEGMIHVGDEYEFEEKTERFVGTVLDVISAADSNKFKITLELTSAEHERLTASQ